jgi:hypothetical protein
MAQNHPLITSDRSWRAALAGAGLFILWGIALIANEIPPEWSIPDWFTSLVLYIFIFGLFLTPVVMILAWCNNFPVWSYPYTVHFVIFSLYMTMVATPGLRLFRMDLFGRQVWGWRAWLPLLVIALVSLLLTRSFRPLAHFFTNIRADWTVLLFGFSGLLPLFVFIAFDEQDRLYSLIFMVILTALMVGMAWMYMISQHKRTRMLILLLGMLAVITTAILAPGYI